MAELVAAPRPSTRLAPLADDPNGVALDSHVVDRARGGDLDHRVGLLAAAVGALAVPPGQTRQGQLPPRRNG